jgi:DNA polymerase V
MGSGSPCDSLHPRGMIMPRYYALVDCNNFYVSCERVFNPSLQGRPVVILSNNDGCAVARSNEAKILDIPFGSPWFKIRKEMEHRGVTALSSNYTLYGDMSARVMEVLSFFSPDMEVYSIDEAFLLFHGTREFLEELGHEIRRTVKQWTGIPVSVGLAPTKTLAKLAARRAKKGDGVFLFTGTSDDDPLLETFDAGDVWGIGTRQREKLAAQGVRSARDLKYAQENWIQKKLTITGLRTVMELRGHSSIPFEEAPSPKKAVVTSRSFGRTVTTLEDITEAVGVYTSRCAQKLRAQRSAAGEITVFILTDRFAAAPQHQGSASMTLPSPSSDSLVLIPQAVRIARALFKPGFSYKKAGVMCTRLVDDASVQLNIFAQEKDRSGLMAEIDRINKRFGRKALSFGSGGIERSWSMERKLLTPRYTTRWDELPEVQ